MRAVSADGMLFERVQNFVVGEDLAIHRVVGFGRNSSNHVSRVNVLESPVLLVLFGVLVDLVTQKQSDIRQFHVSACVLFGRVEVHHSPSTSFSDDNYTSAAKFRLQGRCTSVTAISANDKQLLHILTASA